jgi:hypothetical protein
MQKFLANGAISTCKINPWRQIFKESTNFLDQRDDFLWLSLLSTVYLQLFKSLGLSAKTRMTTTLKRESNLF